MSRKQGKSTKTEEGRRHDDITRPAVFSYQLMRPWITRTSPQAYENHAFGLRKGLKREIKEEFLKSQRIARQSRFATSRKSPGVTFKFGHHNEANLCIWHVTLSRNKYYRSVALQYGAKHDKGSYVDHVCVIYFLKHFY